MMKALVLSLCCIVAFQDQEPIPLPKDSVGAWSHEEFDEKNVKTLELRGDNAQPLDEETIALIRPSAVAYTRPQKDQNVQKVFWKAATGRFHFKRQSKAIGAQRLVLEKEVTVETQDGAVLRTEYLEADVASRTYKTDREFRMTRPDLELKGVGLVADEQLREMTISKDFVGTVLGKPRLLGQIPPSPSDAAVTRLISKGPTSLKEVGEPKEPGHYVRVDLSSDVMIEYQHRENSAHVTANRAEAYLKPKEKGKEEKDEKVTYDVQDIYAYGDIRITDSRGADGKASEMVWSEVRDRVELFGDPASLSHRGHHTTAKHLVLDRHEGFFTAQESVKTRIEVDKNAPALSVACEEMTGRVAGIKEEARLEQLEATGHVALSGILSPDEAKENETGRAECEVLRWNADQRRGVLQGVPFVRIFTGANQIASPLVLLAGRSGAVLKGPSWFKIAAGRDAGAESYLIHAPGDLTYDGAGGRIEFLEEARIYTKAIRFQATVLRMTLSKQGITRIVGLRGVTIDRLDESSRLYGDVAEFQPGEHRLALRGRPYAAAVGSQWSTAIPEMIFDDVRKSFTGRGSIRMKFHLSE